MSNDTQPASRFAVAVRMTAIPMIAVVAFAEMVRFVAGDPVTIANDIPSTSQHFYKAYLVAFVVALVFNYIVTGTEEFNV